ncbi:ATP-binding Cassette (ABC) superfamily [Achlya hypogyna]|uniref:ATP-binding Cassette (ABC) superfamily n=1 Tax=Achlya hypogyna TaxID=1202772 RepID=A0A1V9ZUF0_ACHHY|nr:ATP-binding Cassette (ABC) superfamily [Achlya hypogyna]
MEGNLMLDEDNDGIGDTIAGAAAPFHETKDDTDEEDDAERTSCYVGLEFEADWHGVNTVVKGFKHDGRDNPAEAGHIIHVGDVLLAIDSDSVLELSFAEVCPTPTAEQSLATLRRLRDLADGEHTLHFASPEALGDAMRLRPDVRVAKRFIHEHKAPYYRAITTPGRDGLLHGCIERHRGDEVTALHLHREDTGEFLLACSCECDYSGAFVFHTLRDSHLRRWKDLPRSEDSAVYLGQMVPNFLGTEFRVLDHATATPREVAFLVYEANLFGRVPNALTVALGRDSHAGFVTTSPLAPSERVKRLHRGPSVLERLRSWSQEVECFVEALTSPTNASLRATPVQYGAVEQEDHDDLIFLASKKPSWNEEIHAWTLNFDGRVKAPSKKNLLLGASDAHAAMEAEFGDATLLRFGKVSKARFTLDFGAPLSPFVALAVAASAFAHKRIVTS